MSLLKRETPKKCSAACGSCSKARPTMFTNSLIAFHVLCLRQSLPPSLFICYEWMKIYSGGRFSLRKCNSHQRPTCQANARENSADDDKSSRQALVNHSHCSLMIITTAIIYMFFCLFIFLLFFWHFNECVLCVAQVTRKPTHDGGDPKEMDKRKKRKKYEKCHSVREISIESSFLRLFVCVADAAHLKTFADRAAALTWK